MVEYEAAAGLVDAVRRTVRTKIGMREFGQPVTAVQEHACFLFEKVGVEISVGFLDASKYVWRV